MKAIKKALCVVNEERTSISLEDELWIPSLRPRGQHVGSRINMRDRILVISQTELGNCIGVSFQQVQKYEKGKNRVSSGRLQQIADLLKVQVPFFFEGIDGPNRPPMVDEIVDLCNAPGGLALANAFQRVKNKKCAGVLNN